MVEHTVLVDLVYFTYFLVVATLLVAIATIIGIIVSYFLISRSNLITSTYFENDLLLRQLEFLERSTDRIYRSDYGNEILECIKNHDQKPILKENGGKVSERELENFLNDILNLILVKDLKLINKLLIYRQFNWVLEKVQHSPEIINYIKKVQNLQFAPYYQSIIDEKF